MPRHRNPVGIAAGKLILAIQNEIIATPDASDATLGQKVASRARTLLQASQSATVPSLLDGRSVVEYLDADWVMMHPSVKPCIEALIAALEA